MIVTPLPGPLESRTDQEWLLEGSGSGADAAAPLCPHRSSSPGSGGGEGGRKDAEEAESWFQGPRRDSRLLAAVRWGEQGGA